MKTIDATNEWWALEIKAYPEVAKFQYGPLAEEEKMSEVFDNCWVTNEHARVPTPSYQGDPSRIILEDDSGCESQECQVTPIQNRGKSGKKRTCPYSPSPTKNESFWRTTQVVKVRNAKSALFKIVERVGRRGRVLTRQVQRRMISGQVRMLKMRLLCAWWISLCARYKRDV